MVFTADFRDTACMDSGTSDERYQDEILPHVSRTFALTIPQLPDALRVAVTNAYLLCRIADTIEDEPALSPAETLAFLDRFRRWSPAAVSRRGWPPRSSTRLSDRTLPTERELISNMVRVLNVTASLNAPQRAAIQRCVDLMCYGMPRFQFTAEPARACRAARDLDDYCYYVAGVVGEMLTELFCEYSADITPQSRRAAAPRRVLRAGPADDQHPQGRVGGSQPRRLLAAAGGVHCRTASTWRGCRSDSRDARFDAGMRRADRRRACASAQRAGLHAADSRQRGRNPPLLPVGRRPRGSDAAENCTGIRASPPVRKSRSRVRGDHDASSDGSIACATIGCCGVCSPQAARGLPLAALAEASRARRARMQCRSRDAAAPLRELRDMSRIAQKPAAAPAPGTARARARGSRVGDADQDRLDRCSSARIAAARDALIARQSAAGILAVRARGGLHDSRRVHPDDALPGRDRRRARRPRSPPICARIRPSTAAGRCITAATST